MWYALADVLLPHAQDIVRKATQPDYNPTTGYVAAVSRSIAAPGVFC